MRRSHLALCGAGVVLAAAYLALTGVSPGGIGLLVAALACPIAMVVAMAVLMGGRTAPGRPDGRAEPTDADRPGSVVGS